MQSPSQSRRPPPTNGFKPGVSGNPFGKASKAQQRAMVLARATELAEPLGGYENLNALEKTLLEQAATLTLSKPRRHDLRLRTANIVNRIVRDVMRRHGPVGKGGSDLGSLLGAARG
jgi:hypothetical protein